MYYNTGYLHHSKEAYIDYSRPLIVSSCGNFRFFSRPILSTYRPNGRSDYQLIYIASGKAHFYFEEAKEEIITAGHIVLYRPNELQKYDYYAEDQTEVYWVHFTGNDVENILDMYHFPTNEHVIYSGTSQDYISLFHKIIQELQFCKDSYENYLSLLLEQLLLLVKRFFTANQQNNSVIHKEVEAAIHYFNEHYQELINIDAYASSLGLSSCWFIRIFRQYTGLTPLNYILRIRIATAQTLLESSPYNIAEISRMVGYDNALYFSRLFKNHTGFSPSEYRKLKRN